MKRKPEAPSVGEHEHADGPPVLERPSNED
jgi:hypothetical protein